MLSLVADWHRTYKTLDDIRNDLNDKSILKNTEKVFEVYDKVWIESATDTLLIAKMETPKGNFHVQCWNSVGIREAISKLLGLPVFTMKG